MNEKEPILVIGGGASGLTAARELATSYSVTILEARERLGGRIYSKHPNIELGAEFVHGRDPELWSMARAAGMLLYEVGGEHRYARHGRLEADDAIWEKTGQIFSRMEQERADVTFADFLRRDFSGVEWGDARDWAIAYVEGFNAADHRRVGIQWLNESERASRQIDGERQFRSANGYAPLIRWLEEECTRRGVVIVREAVVHSIVWRPGHVEARTSAGVFQASAAIVTVPLGVLQDPAAIRFDPDIAETRAAAQRLAFGPVVRLVLQCRQPFWEEHGLAKLSFLHARDEQFPTWWTEYPLQTNLLTAWVAGPKAQAIEPLPEREQFRIALESLAQATSMTPAALERMVEQIHYHDWQHDPFARGAYSYVPAGALHCVERLGAQCGQTLFFAGEATDTTGHMGTVHGAIASGLRAAREALHK